MDVGGEGGWRCSLRFLVVERDEAEGVANLAASVTRAFPASKET